MYWLIWSSVIFMEIKYASFFNPFHITADSISLASWGGYNTIRASNALVDNYHGTSMQTLTSKGNINKYIENRSNTTLFVSFFIPSTLWSNDCSGGPKTSKVVNLEHICNEASWYCNITNQRDRNRRKGFRRYINHTLLYCSDKYS